MYMCLVPQLCGLLGKNTGVGCHFLLQGIFLTQGSNLGFVLQVDSLPSELEGKPHIHLTNCNFHTEEVCEDPIWKAIGQV